MMMQVMPVMGCKHGAHWALTACMRSELRGESTWHSAQD